ncbi:hypothetical protein BN1723_016034 [Verticillium longisporum]|uniref:Uncharacterized protein n=1 Tax=Verticillium longisporum TaxID=100787 RepID=A0A0G4N6S0_VERLO|nr:hypothetical protein BN1723_016034 [Verticillium longisporum]
MSRLRGHLLDDAAIPFRRRNPRTAATLTSPYAPAVGASLAGLALGVYPAQQLRVSVAIYAMFRALEFGWNLCEGEGMIWGFKAGGRVKRERPWWWGSWMIQPFAFGQLLHAVVFDRDCFPAAYGNLIFNNSTAYLQQRPAGYPSHLVWPKTLDIVDSLAQMAKLNWPRAAPLDRNRDMTSAAPGPSRPPNAPRTLTPKSVSDPVLRNALRYTISAREYATLGEAMVGINCDTMKDSERLATRGCSDGRDNSTNSARRNQNPLLPLNVFIEQKRNDILDTVVSHATE